MRTFLYGDNEVENFECSFFIHIPYCVKHERDYSLTWEGQNCENDESSIYSTVQYSTVHSTPQYGEARAGCQVLSVRSPLLQPKCQASVPVLSARHSQDRSVCVCILEACTTLHQVVQEDE